MANSIETWLDLANAAPLPELKVKDASDLVMQILSDRPVEVQIGILKMSLFRLARKHEGVKLLTLFTKDINGRYTEAIANMGYANPVSTKPGGRRQRSSKPTTPAK